MKTIETHSEFGREVETWYCQCGAVQLVPVGGDLADCPGCIGQDSYDMMMFERERAEAENEEQAGILEVEDWRFNERFPDEDTF